MVCWCAGTLARTCRPAGMNRFSRTDVFRRPASDCCLSSADCDGGFLLSGLETDHHTTFGYNHNLVVARMGWLSNRIPPSPGYTEIACEQFRSRQNGHHGREHHLERDHCGSSRSVLGNRGLSDGVRRFLLPTARAWKTPQPADSSSQHGRSLSGL